MRAWFLVSLLLPASVLGLEGDKPYPPNGDKPCFSFQDQMNAVLARNQNGVNFPDMQEWLHHIKLGAAANIDTFLSNKDPDSTPANPTQSATLNRQFGPNSYSNIFVTTLNLISEAQLASWAKTRITLLGGGSSPLSINNDLPTNEYSIGINEAFVDIVNADYSGFYGRFGRQYLPYGTYKLFPVLQDLTQLLTQDLQTAITAGYVAPYGIHLSAYVYTPLNSTTCLGHNSLNAYGANFGVINHVGPFYYQIETGYINNLAQVDYVYSSDNINGNNDESCRYLKTVGAVAFDFLAYIYNFNFAFHYTTAITPFNRPSLANWENGEAVGGAKPWAGSIGAGYHIRVGKYPSQLNGSYQWSGQAMSVGSEGMPLNRTEFDYTVTLNNNFDLAGLVYKDKDYSTSNGGTGISSLTGVVRIALRYS